MKSLSEKGQMKVSELADLFEVSMETIRKDLSALSEAGLIDKSHGSARIKNGPLMLPVSMRLDEKVAMKEQIGRRAVDFIKDGMTIWLDTGTTVLAMIPFLHMKKNLMIVTDSIVAAAALMDTRHRLFVIGGMLDPLGMSLTGPGSIDMLSTFHFDAAFFGTNGFGETRQPSTSSLNEVTIKREVLKRSSWSCLLADQTKFESSGAFVYAHFSSLNCIITNTVTEEQREMVKDIEQFIDASLPA